MIFKLYIVFRFYDHLCAIIDAQFLQLLLAEEFNRPLQQSLILINTKFHLYKTRHQENQRLFASFHKVINTIARTAMATPIIWWRVIRSPATSQARMVVTAG